MSRRSHSSNRKPPDSKKTVSMPIKNVDELFKQGFTLHQQGQLAQAWQIYLSILKLQPAHADTLYFSGLIAAQSNNPLLAVELFNKAIEVNPDHLDAQFNCGIALQEIGRFNDALIIFDRLIELNPSDADNYYNRGNVFQRLSHFERAVADYDRTIDITPNHSQALYSRGNALQGLKHYEEAVASYTKAIAVNPKYSDAHHNQGNAFQILNLFEEALDSFDRSIELSPYQADSHSNRGNALLKLKRFDEALASYARAIEISPDYADAYLNLGNALLELKRFDKALLSYSQAIEINPDLSDAYSNRGNTLLELKLFDQAIANYDHAIQLNPNYAAAFFNRGHALLGLNQKDEALTSYKKALSLAPEQKYLWVTQLHTQMHLCNWTDLPNELEKLEISITNELMVLFPFPVLGLIDKPELQLKASRLYVAEDFPVPNVTGIFKNTYADKKIRVAYYSADFHNHATSYLIAELFETHDKQKFELFGFSFGPYQQDEMRRRIASGFTHFYDVTHKSNREVAQMSRDLGIDIAVDLKGFTQDSRVGIFAEQCAPIQINYLGYPGTLAAPYYDYIIADKILIPKESQHYYTEKIVYLPHSYQVNDSKRKISPKLFTKQELGLPENSFVFCCFNNNYKILPATFDAWMRILNKVDNSVLWLMEDSTTGANNLRKEAEKRGADPSRLVFAPRMKLEDHLARHRCADLFLDTLPYNAHTTASDALWTGLPVLTKIGQSFAARVAASLLNVMQLPELITKTQEEYEQRAIELATNPFGIAEIKAKLEKNRLTSPLFNGQLFARHIELAFSEIHSLHMRGEKPEHIYIESLL